MPYLRPRRVEQNDESRKDGARHCSMNMAYVLLVDIMYYVADATIADSPIQLIEMVWLHGGSTRLGDDPPFQLLVLCHQVWVLSSIVYLQV